LREAHEHEKKQLIAAIKDLSEQNDILKSNSSEEFVEMQERLKEQYERKMLDQENDFVRYLHSSIHVKTRSPTAAASADFRGAN
jgi:hypothetical protein